jgi:hypothetical protein
LIEINYYSYKDFLVADPCLREAFELLMKLFHFYDNNPRKVNLKPGFERAQELLDLASELIVAVLKVYFYFICCLFVFF